MPFANYLDFPCFVVCASVLAYGFGLAGKNKRMAFLIARDASVPMGLIGTLIGCQQMLTYLADPNSIGPALSVAYLTPLYSIVIMVFANVAASVFPERGEAENQKQVLSAPRVAATLLLLFGVVFAAIMYGGNVLTFIDLTALLCVVFFTLVPVLLSKGGESRSFIESKLLAARDYSLATSAIGILIAWVGVLRDHGDPSAIGPSISIGFLTTLYGGLIFMVSTMLYRATTNRDIPHLLGSTSAYAVLASFVTGSFFTYIFFLF